jgi:hypothetical protein
MAFADNFVIVNDNRTNRHLVSFARLPCFSQCKLHKQSFP